MNAVIVLLLFGLSANAQPADINVDDVMRYAPEKSDVMLYVNVEATAKPTWKWLTEELAEEEFLQGKEVKTTLLDARAEVEQGLREFQNFTGIDVLNDFKYLVVWFNSTDLVNERFEFLVVLNGNWPDDLAEKVATFAGFPESEQAGASMVYYKAGGPGGPPMAIAQVDKDVIFGSYEMVLERAESSYERPSADKDSQLARVAKSLSGGPAMLLSYQPGQSIRSVMKTAKIAQSASDMLLGMSWVDLALYHDGLDLDLEARSDEMFERHAMVLNGLVELMRASQLGLRGLSRMALGALSEKDSELDPEVRAILQYRKAAMEFVEKYSGDGDFKLVDASDKKKRRVRLELRAGHVREIYSPLIGVLIGGGMILNP